MDIFHLSWLQKLIRFGVVGTSGLCVDFSITWLLREKGKLNQYIANTAGFCAAVCSNFYLNYIWTFKGEVSNVTVAFGSFLAVALLGLILNNGVIYLCNKLFKLQFYRSKIIAVLTVFLWNFSINYFITFHS